MASTGANTPVNLLDPDVHALIKKEIRRQCGAIDLIASENLNFPSLTLTEAMAVLGNQNYSNTGYINDMEELCRARALKLFCLNPTEWGVVIVQPYSGSPAMFTAHTAVLHPNDRIMGLDLLYGGHVTHGGYYTVVNKYGYASSINLESLPYEVDPGTGYIDYDELSERAMDFRPKLMFCGGESYPRDWDYKRLRSIADKCGAVLLCDMADIGGLVAAKEAADPFEYCDLITTSIHTSFRGPEASLIFYKKGFKETLCHDAVYYFEDKIDFVAFLSPQRGPHNHHGAALAVALKQAMSPDFKAYAKQVKVNATALGNYLMNKGYKLVSNGTDNHLVLWDLQPLGLTGNKIEKLCDECNIFVNKNAVFCDSNASALGGVQIGTLAMTSRGLVEDNFEQIGEFLHRAVAITLNVQKEYGKLLKYFNKGLVNNKDIENLKADVEKFASSFDMPGVKSYGS